MPEDSCGPLSVVTLHPHLLAASTAGHLQGPLCPWPLPPPPLTFSNPLSQALEFMVVQTAPTQLSNLAASSQGPPHPSSKLALLTTPSPYNSSSWQGVIIPPLVTFAVFFSSSDYQMQDPPLLAASALFLGYLSILIFNSHLYVDNSQIDNVASDTFPGCGLHFQVTVGHLHQQSLGPVWDQNLQLSPNKKSPITLLNLFLLLTSQFHKSLCFKHPSKQWSNPTVSSSRLGPATLSFIPSIISPT